jgi:hypothetical protein
MKTDTYEVNFTYTDPNTLFQTRCSEIICLDGKDKHMKAAKEIVKKYKLQGITIDIINVIYQ